MISQEFASVDHYLKAVASFAEKPCGNVDPLVRWGVDLYELWKSEWREEKSLEDAFRFSVMGKVLHRGKCLRSPLCALEARMFKLFGHHDAIAYFEAMHEMAKTRKSAYGKSPEARSHT